MVGMIYRVVHFRNLTEYLTAKDGVEVLGGESLLADPDARGEELTRAVTSEMGLLQQLRPKVEKGAAHMVVSLPPGESLEEDTWREVAQRSLRELGFEDSPYFFVKHNDTDKEHIHIVAGTVTRNNELVSNAFEGRRMVAHMARLREELSLTHEKLDPKLSVEPPPPSPTPPQPLPTRQPDRADLLRRHLAKASSLKGYIVSLRKAGVHTSWTVSRSTGRVSGVSYQLGDRWYKGRQLGKDLAHGPIEERLGSPSVRDLREALLANKHVCRGRVRVRKKLTEADVAELRSAHPNAKAGDVVEVRYNGVYVNLPAEKLNPYARSGRDLEGILEHELGQSEDLASFLRHLEEHGVQAQFHFTKNGHPRGVSFRAPDGKWHAGSKVGHAWSRLREQFKPTLQDLPVLLRANLEHEKAITEVKRILDEKQLHARGARAKQVLVYATPREVHLVPVTTRGRGKPRAPARDFVRQRAKLRAAVRGYLRTTRLDPAKLDLYEELSRAAAYADGRLYRDLGSYQEVRQVLRVWRAGLVAGDRDDLREYLVQHERFQRIRALRLYRSARARHHRTVRAFKALRPGDEATAGTYVLLQERARRLASVARHFAPTKAVLEGSELAMKASAPVAKTGLRVPKAALALAQAPLSVARMGAEMAAENLLTRALELPDSARLTYRILRGRFTSVAITAAIKAIKADDGESAALSLSAKASMAVSRNVLKARL